jgi:2-C-methyl-D-erythritol 2,4-cyclodiphosphate synthase
MATLASQPFRIGHGWDTHRIESGRPLIIGGVAIPAEFGLAGHSDADILLHAITDALLGALALGDIGMHFPDSAPEWKDAGSRQFVVHAMELVRRRRFRLVNVDSTVILERPKLKDFRTAIRENLSAILELPVEAISVKFKTAERVGPVGEGRSSEAHAIVLLAAV